MPRTRILRTLSRFDSASCEDINLALDNLEKTAANATRSVSSAWSSRVSSSASSVDTAQTVGARTTRAFTRYRITKAGRDQLRELIARAEVNEGGGVIE
jgi:hypothetical protein